MHDAQDRAPHAGTALCFFYHFSRILIIPERDKLGMPELSPSVHSRNSITATSLGRTQTHFFIFSASKISPHLARPVSGRFTNGHLSVTSGFTFSWTILRVAGTNPFRTRATY